MLINSVAHLDVSLENFVIKKAKFIKDPETSTLSFDFKNSQIKLIDFGLAKIFHPNTFNCNLYVGKTRYQPPEMIARKKVFQADKADVWSLGVSIYSFISGHGLFEEASAKDMNFKQIVDGKKETYFYEIIQKGNRLDYFELQAFHLLVNMLKYEDERYDMFQVKNHIWFKQ